MGQNLIAVDTSVHPATQFACGVRPVPLIHPPPQRRRLQPSCPEVEREIHDGCQPALRLAGQHRAVAQRGGKSHRQVMRQTDLRFFLRDGWMRRIAGMPVPNHPVTRWVNVRMGAVLRIKLRHTVKVLEPLGQFDGSLWHLSITLTWSGRWSAQG